MQRLQYFLLLADFTDAAGALLTVTFTVSANYTKVLLTVKCTVGTPLSGASS